MPVAGWYPDPDRQATWRYWDGAMWTHHSAPMHAATPRDPYSFGAWFEDSRTAVGAVLRRVAVAVVIANLVISRGSGWHLLGAAAFISMALPLIVFFALQRYFVQGLLAGSVK